MEDSPELQKDSNKKRRVRRSKSQIYIEEVGKVMEKLWKHPDKRVIKAIKATETKEKIAKPAKNRRKRR